MRKIDADVLWEAMRKDPMGGLNWESIINEAPTVPDELEEYAAPEDYAVTKKTEDKLRDLTGAKKALSDIIGQAWDKGYKLGRLKHCLVPPESSWVISEISNGFGTFKRRTCKHCGKMRAQMPLNFCGYCGHRMTNVAEVEEEDGTRVGG